jgi:hypothetical protein
MIARDGNFHYRYGFESRRARTVSRKCRRGPSPPPCPLLHADLDRLNSEYAALLRSTYLRPAEPGPALRAGPTISEPAFTSLWINARGASAVAPSQTGGEEESPSGASSEAAPDLVFCAKCRQPIRRNEILSISFCPIHGLSEPFAFVPLSQKRLQGA